MRARLIYFMRPVGMPGPIKIGCSHIPEDRLYALSAWSPFPLEFIGKIAGDLSDEQRIHHQLRAHHSHREWFHAAPEVIELVEALCAGRVQVLSLPPGKRLGPPRHYGKRRAA